MSNKAYNDIRKRPIQLAYSVSRYLVNINYLKLLCDKD